jgi:hypothetical protein
VADQLHDFEAVAEMEDAAGSQSQRGMIIGGISGSCSFDPSQPHSFHANSYTLRIVMFSMTNAERMKLLRQQRKLENLCTGCGSQPPISNKTKCERCAKAANRSIKNVKNRYKSKGLCSVCGKNPNTGNTIKCLKCGQRGRKREKTRYHNAIASKKCVGCSSVADSGKFCFQCWMKSRARFHFGDSNKAVMLFRIWQRQEGKCIYTGEKLIPGIRHASLDHITPKSKGGSDLENNLQWISFVANIMKHTMSHEEFIAICKRIVERHVNANVSIN